MQLGEWFKRFWPFSNPSLAESAAAKEPEIEYYRTDGGAILATVGTYGFTAFLEYDEKENNWQHLDLNSPRGDMLHQEIFLAHRATGLYGPPIGAPPLPLDQPGVYHPKEYYQQRPPVPCEEVPNVTALLREAGGTELVVHIVLREDRYETLHGDGRFHYLDAVYIKGKDAKRHPEHASGNYHYHLRKMTLCLDGNHVCWSNFKLELFDHYDPERVVKELEERLKAAQAQ
jgi:hypothetical protein